jgi:hypothetical protein
LFSPTRAIILATALILVAPLGGTGTAAADAAPTITWDGTDIWFIHHVLGLNLFSATACDPHGGLTTLYVRMPQFSEGGFTSMPAGTGCATLTSKMLVDHSAGEFRVTSADVVAKSAEGQVVKLSVGDVHFGLFPLRASSVSGYPDFGAYPAPAAKSAYSAIFILNGDGSVAAYKLRWNGVTQADTIQGAVAGPGQHFLVVSGVEGGSPNTPPNVSLDGKQVKQNPVTYAGTGPWWNFMATSSPSAAVNGEQGALIEAAIGTFPEESATPVTGAFTESLRYSSIGRVDPLLGSGYTEQFAVPFAATSLTIRVADDHAAATAFDACVNVGAFKLACGGTNNGDIRVVHVQDSLTITRLEGFEAGTAIGVTRYTDTLMGTTLAATTTGIVSVTFS